MPAPDPNITVTKTTTTGQQETPFGETVGTTSTSTEVDSISQADVAELEALFPGLAGTGFSLATVTAAQLAAAVPLPVLSAALTLALTPKAT